MIHIHVWLERIFQAQHTTYDIHISAAVPANPSQYLSREQQHYHLPRPGRHHLLSNGKGAKFGQVSTNQAQSKRKAFLTLFPLTHWQIMVFIVSKTSSKYSHAKIGRSRKLTRWHIRQTDSIWLRWWESVGLVLWWEKSRRTMWLIG